MRPPFVAGACILGLMFIVLPGNRSWTAQSLPARPPAALDRLYPPRSDRPLLLMQVMELSAPLSGIMINHMEHDSINVRANYERFKSEYRAAAALVPEWKSRFPVKPIEDLGKALGSGNESKIMASAEKLGKVCESCHARMASWVSPGTKGT